MIHNFFAGLFGAASDPYYQYEAARQQQLGQQQLYQAQMQRVMTQGYGITVPKWRFTSRPWNRWLRVSRTWAQLKRQFPTQDIPSPEDLYDGV